MRVGFLLCFIITVSEASVRRSASTCSEIMDCVTCSSSPSWFGLKCRWCMLDNKCHAVASPHNPCPIGKSITHSAMCYDEQYGVYDADAAYLNTLLSAVAYSEDPETCFGKLLSNSGFELHAAVPIDCNYFEFSSYSLFEYNHCFAYIAVSHIKKLIVLAYRGTSETTQLIEELLTTVTIPKKSFSDGGYVQAYFHEAYQKLKPCVFSLVKNLVQNHPDYEILVTGHSLGAAMASLASFDLVYEKVVKTNKMSLYSFGMPRVGDEHYALNHDRLVNNSWRVVHYNDVVARLPSCVLLDSPLCNLVSSVPYHHQTTVYYPEKDMLPESNYTICKNNEDPACKYPFVKNVLRAPEYADSHKNYFSVNIGSECKELTRREKRSASSDELWQNLSNKTCRVYSFNRDEVSTGTRVMKPHILLMFLTFSNTAFFMSNVYSF